MRVRASGLLVLALLLVTLPFVLTDGGADAATATVPRPEHVVIVVEENHSATNILGNPEAPYINELAQQNANFTQSYALTHPSQPNYLALFSGSFQGVTNDTCPNTFTGANLGSQLRSAGFGFTGYSEGLPSAGSTTCGNTAKYVRKHSPWVNFSNLPGTTNQPLTAFPSDFNDLPPVSFVIPNLNNDMHDGTIAQGDAWLKSNLKAYVDWAKTHNSLFVLTFDEDDKNDNNRIPTIMAGERVVPGTYDGRIDHYSMLRTLQDAYGLAPLGGSASAQPILDVWSPDDGNMRPTADFTGTCPDATCSFDASDSDDPDGNITSYAWNFGDGKTGSGETTSHLYGSGGSKQVTLTVTDNQGATDSVTKTVNPAGTAPFAADGFNRTVSNGWGSADVGGAWGLTGKTTLFSVSPGAARMSPTAGATLTSALGSTSSDDTDVTATFSSDKAATGSGVQVSLIGRRVSVGNDYRAKVRLTSTNTATLTLSRNVGKTESGITPAITIPGLTVSPNKKISVRLQVTGTSPTTVRARVWDAAGTEPSNWAQTATDSTGALQSPGAVGVSTYLSSNSTNAPVVAFSSLTAQHTATGGPTNTPPTAAFSSLCSVMSCGFDGSGSTDPGGSVTSYDWTFGDGATETGPTPGHAYTTPGTYNVTLKVTDNQGATDSVTHPVTVSAATGQTLARDTFGRTVTNGWGTADVGGAWSLTGTSSAFSVGSGSGAMTVAAGKQVTATLGGVNSSGTDLTFGVSTDKLTAATFLTVTGRRPAEGTGYRAKLKIVASGAVTVSLTRQSGGTETTLGGATVPGLTFTAGMPLRARVQVFGTNPTTLRAKVWTAAGSEPASWLISRTDSTAALQAPGSIALTTYLTSTATNGPITGRFSDLTASPTP